MDATSTMAAGLINANNTLFNVLIRTLHDRGLIDKDVLRQTLLDIVHEPKPQTVPRYDLAQFENLAKLLTDPDPEPRWRPVVIQGGKHDPINR